MARGAEARTADDGGRRRGASSRGRLLACGSKRAAQLLLEGGPSLGSVGHLRLVHEIAAVLAAHAGGGKADARDRAPRRTYALVGLGMSIELGALSSLLTRRRRSTTCCASCAVMLPVA